MHSDMACTVDMRFAYIHACVARSHPIAPFYLAHTAPSGATRILPLSAYSSSTPSHEYTLIYIDPCPLATHPGWPLRTLLTAVAMRWGWIQHDIRIISMRDVAEWDTWDASKTSSSVVFTVRLSGDVDAMRATMPKVIGWERNPSTSKLMPRVMDMGALMG